MDIQEKHARRVLFVGLALGALVACSGGGDDRAKENAAPRPATAEDPAGEAAAASEATSEVSMAPAGSPWAETGDDASSASPATPVEPSPAGPDTPTETPTLGPAITFEKRTHDFGPVWDVDKQTFAFAFTNTGDERLVITQVKPSCGCTATQLEQKEYEPGEGAAIEVAFSPKGFGRQSKYIDVLSNTRQGATRLTIAAEIKSFVEVEPHTLSMGEVALGREHTATFQIDSIDKGLEVVSLNTTARGGSALLRGAARGADLMSTRLVGDETGGDAGGPPYEIEVTLHDTAPWGRVYGSISLECRGRLDADQEPFVTTKLVPVNATVVGELRADQFMFRVAVVRPGDTFERRIRLTRVTSEPFAILATKVLRSSMQDVTARAEPIRKPGVNGYELILSGDSGGYRGTVSGVVRVTTDVPGEDVLDFQFAGNIRDVTK